MDPSPQYLYISNCPRYSNTIKQKLDPLPSSHHFFSSFLFLSLPHQLDLSLKLGGIESELFLRLFVTCDLPLGLNAISRSGGVLPSDETVSNARSMSVSSTISSHSPIESKEMVGDSPVVDSTSTNKRVESMVLSPQLESSETTNRINLGVVRLAPRASRLDVIGNERITLLLSLPQSLGVPTVICESREMERTEGGNVPLGSVLSGNDGNVVPVPVRGSSELLDEVRLVNVDLEVLGVLRHLDLVADDAGGSNPSVQRRSVSMGRTYGSSMGPRSFQIPWKTQGAL